MNIKQFFNLRKGDLVTCYKQVFRVTDTSAKETHFVDNQLGTVHIRLSPSSSSFDDFVRHLFYSDENGQPLARPGCACVMHWHYIEVEVPSSERAREVATQYADIHLREAVIVDWYERGRDGLRVVWSLHLCQITQVKGKINTPTSANYRPLMIGPQ